MEIEGWAVRVSPEGNMLRNSPQNPSNYMITIVKHYAIDIELPKEDVDKIPENQLQETLTNTIKKIIQQHT